MAISNGINPSFDAIGISNSSAFIIGGVGTGTAAIILDVKAKAGAVGNGSMYVSQNGNGELWFLLAGVWTQVTIN